VEFWKRELDTMREEECVDWSTAYTLWRNMLVDYEIHWSEWDGQLYLPPTMWDWEDHTQKVYKKRKTLASLVCDESEVLLWDVRPDIVAEVSTSEAAIADPDDTDTSAFAPKPFQLDTRPTLAALKVKGAEELAQGQDGSLASAGGRSTRSSGSPRSPVMRMSPRSLVRKRSPRASTTTATSSVSPATTSVASPSRSAATALSSRGTKSVSTTTPTRRWAPLV
jgi:hypothetical protein